MVKKYWQVQYTYCSLILYLLKWNFVPVKKWDHNLKVMVDYSRYSLIKSYLILSILHSMSNTSFHFMPHHPRVSCVTIGLTINAITVTITVKGQRWRLLIYALRNFLLRNNVVFSEATTTVLERFTNSIGKHLCWSVFFLEII